MEIKERPMAQAAYLLARHFGWEPEVLQRMTMAQIDFYVDMLREETRAAAR